MKTLSLFRTALFMTLLTSAGFATAENGNKKENTDDLVDDKKVVIKIDQLYLGVGVNHNRIDSSSLLSGDDGKASGSQVFFGYTVGQRHGVEGAIETGYIQSDDLYDNSNIDVDGLWFSGVLRKPLPEIHHTLSAVARGGWGLKGDDGLFVGGGAQFNVHPHLFVRLEYLHKDLSQSYQVNLGFVF